MENSRPSPIRLRKVCPHCNTILHVRRAVCGCDHAFPSKKKACNDKMIAVKHARALESQHEASLRKEQDRLRKASIKASETYEQTLHRQEQEKVRKASMTASETCEQSMHRQEQERVHKASMRTSETFEQTMHRPEQNKMHMASMRAFETQHEMPHRKNAIKRLWQIYERKRFQ